MHGDPGSGPVDRLTSAGRVVLALPQADELFKSRIRFTQRRVFAEPRVQTIIAFPDVSASGRVGLGIATNGAY
jgi:hypothetical protein